MDVAAQSVEARLADASRNCSSRLLEKKARNLKEFNESMEKKGAWMRVVFGCGDHALMGSVDREKYTFAAQLSVLQACPSVLSALLHRDQGTLCLLTAKIFVISRLLLKSLTEKVLSANAREEIFADNGARAPSPFLLLYNRNSPRFVRSCCSI